MIEALVITDPQSMTASANASSQHVGSLARWEKIARAADPELDDALAAERAEQLRADYFRAIGQRSIDTRRANGMMTAANASPMHPSNPQRWVLLAREQSPEASADEIAQIAAELRAEHYRRIWQTRRAAAGKSR